MRRQKMPAAEVEIDVALVRRLLESQRPDLCEEDLTPLSYGWDNVSFRVGRDHVARLPRRALAAGLIDNEASCLPVLAQVLPLPVPTPEFVGEPAHGYPWRWLIAPFLEGEPAGMVGGFDEALCSVQMGEFLDALHRPAPADAPDNPFRGGPLVDREEATRPRLAVVTDMAARSRLESLWDESQEVEPFSDDPVWLHGDLHPLNVLVDDDRVSGVIDFGDITSGDPATDLVVAWNFVPGSHQTFWETYGARDETLRLRARGWAISLGLAYVANSADNPVLESIGELTLSAVVDLS